MASKTARESLGDSYIVCSPANPTIPCQILQDSEKIRHLVSGVATVLVGRSVSLIEGRDQGANTPTAPFLDVPNLG